MNPTGFCNMTVKGETVGLKFAIPALEMIDKKGKILYKKDFTMLVYTTMGYAYIAYAGYYVNCQRKEIEDKFTYEDFIEEIEEHVGEPAFNEMLQKVIKTYEDSIRALTEKTKEVVVDDEEKKTKT